MSDQNKHKRDGEASQQQEDKILHILGFGEASTNHKVKETC